jgi:hypothetical protein
VRTFGLDDVDFKFESDGCMDNLPQDFVSISYLDISNLSGTLTAGVLSYADVSREALKFRMGVNQLLPAHRGFQCTIFLQAV